MASATLFRLQLRGFPAVIVGACLIACEAKQPKPTETSAGGDETTADSAGAPSTQPNDPELAAAVRQAAKQAAAGAASGDESQPPPNGILGSERADAEAKAGSLPKVTVGSTGSEPRVALGGGLPGKVPGSFEVAIRAGRGAMPSVAFKVEVSEAAAEAKEEGAAAQQQLTFAVKGAGLAARQPGQLPPSAGDDIAKLKGSTVEFPVADGYLFGMPTVKRAKGALEDLDMMLTVSADAMGTIYVAYPKEPVGNGAFWMVTSREVFMGSDVVAYRMYKVAAASPTEVSLEVNTKRYLAAPHVGFPGLTEREVVQFQGQDEGQLRLKVGRALPVDGQLSQRMLAVVRVPDQPERGAPFQFESQVSFAFPAATTVTASAPAK